MNRAHGEVHPVRPLMGSTQCGACLKEYFTMGKLKARLIRSGIRRSQLIGRGVREAAQPGLGCHEDTQRFRAWDNRVPPLVAEGPRWPELLGRDFDTEHVALYEDIFLGIMDYDIADFERYARACIIKYDISWTCCRATLREVLRQCVLGIPDIAAEKLRQFEEIVRRLASSSAWPFLQEA